ncbi:MAG: hypothetical protein PHY99_01940 [Bacteroidales bacterium]|nr:hypothetical protein [Bacteroidales bacterium]
MKLIKLTLIAICVAFASAPELFSQMSPADQKISVIWQKASIKGSIEVLNGEFSKATIIGGKGKVKGNSFSFSPGTGSRLDISISNAHITPGSGSTIITLMTENNPFSFLLRDISKDYPVFIPEYGVIVTDAADGRTYLQIRQEIESRKLLTKNQKAETLPEQSYEAAAAKTRDQVCPTWLGTSRDARIFEVTNGRHAIARGMDLIRPLNASTPLIIPEISTRDIQYNYITGRGQGIELITTRNLEEGTLPILQSTLTDDDIQYSTTSFVTLESSALKSNTTFGTEYLVADSYCIGHTFTKEHEEQFQAQLLEEQKKIEETVLWYRAVAVNTASVPRYAWFKTVKPYGINSIFDNTSGFSSFSAEKVFGISTLNGKPLPNEEIAVLLKPGETAIFEFTLPHSPVSKERAVRLSKQSFDDRHAECKAYWKSKLSKAAQIELPEKRIEEMIQAGLLHLDLITYGKEPAGTLTPSIGVYSPIGTESSPIIQFYNSMGWHENARRSLQFFLDKQLGNGMIQNFGGYMVETGAALWSMGEYFRYTGDTAWVKQVEPKLLKACDFLMQWRERNKKEELRGKGYGMIDGKVADPEDQFHQFMLNGYAYLGLDRVAEILKNIDPVNAKKLKMEAEAWKSDIRISFFNSMAHSPVVPLGDGTWCPTVPPWTETTGPRALFLNNETFFSHGTFTVPDALLGPLYLVFCEVLSPEEQASKMMLSYHTELLYQKNSTFSQPYYSRNNWLQLKLGMTKPFLENYYNTFSAISDRETYTFWEHLYHVSVHKTHEEAWFLMETRWMLWMEEGTTLRLLKGIPRDWMKDGEKIALKNVASYFGPVSLTVQSNISNNNIEATIECTSDRKPQQISVRLPHPDGLKAKSVTGGKYDPLTETVVVESFTGKAIVKLGF